MINITNKGISHSNSFIFNLDSYIEHWGQCNKNATISDMSNILTSTKFSLVEDNVESIN